MNGQRCKDKSSRHAFTLVEMLVVMAIVLLLIAIMVPVSRRAIESARAGACQSNLRQIAAAVLYYANDHGGRTPDFHWSTQYLQFEALAPYISPGSDVFRCPSATEQNRGAAFPAVYCADTGDGQVCTDYKINDDDLFADQNVLSFRDPTWVVLVADIDWGQQGSHERHRGGEHYAFMAGHVQWISREDSHGEDPYGNTPWYQWGLE